MIGLCICTDSVYQIWCVVLLTTVAGYHEGTFDVILSGIVTPVCLSHDHDLLTEYARILKPSGLLIIREPIVDQGINDCSIRISFSVQQVVLLD